MILLLHIIIQELRCILPLESFRLIEGIARDVGNCAICREISPRDIIIVKIRPSLYHVEVAEFYHWDADVCNVNGVASCDLRQKVCESCGSLFRSFSKNSYFSQMEYLTDIRNARRTLVPI